MLTLTSHPFMTINCPVSQDRQADTDLNSLRPIMSQEYTHITTATLTQPRATAVIFHRVDMGSSETASAWPKVIELWS